MEKKAPDALEMAAQEIKKGKAQEKIKKREK
jgi:hypothetical protein